MIRSLQSIFSRRLLLASLLTVSVGVGAAANAGPPNVVILYADDLGYGDVSGQNPASKIPTPHLDRLANEGVRFTDGHSSSGICTPSRYALLTGRYHWRTFHGIVDSFGGSKFADGELTLPEVLQSAGYHTAHIGKWHLGFDWDAIENQGAPTLSAVVYGKTRTVMTPASYDWSRTIPGGPTAHGFDYSFTDGVINFPPYGWIENDRMVTAPDTQMDTAAWKPLKEGRWECRPGPMVTGWDPYENLPKLARKAVGYIEERSQTDAPFFLYLAFSSPHAPIVPNDAFDGTSQAGPYGDFVVETDDACGQVLAALERTGQAENTVVIFTADNGPEIYAYARDTDYDHWSSAPLRGGKRDLYEGGHHVPFIVRYPGVAARGGVSDALVSQTDIMATLVEIAGAEIPDDQAIDSQSFLPVLHDAGAAVRTATVHNTWKGSYAVRQGDWVLVHTPDILERDRERRREWDAKHGYPDVERSAGELYNLSTDPGQRNNLAAEHPERVETLGALLGQIQHQSTRSARD